MKKMEVTVKIYAGGRPVPDGTSMGTEIVKLRRHQRINVRIDLHSFVSSVQYRLKKNQPFSRESALPRKEEPVRVANKSYKSLLTSLVIIAVLLVLLKTMFIVERETPGVAEPRFRVCLTLFRNTVFDRQTVKRFSDD